MAVELWLLFAVMTAVFWAISNVIDKLIIPKHVRSPIPPLFIIGTFNLIAALIVASVVQPFEISMQNVFLGVLAGFFWGLVPFVYFTSLLTQDVSRVISLFSVSPLLTLTLATIFLGEVLAYEKYVGVFSIIAGSALISLRFDGKNRPSLNKKLLVVLTATVMIAISHILAKSVLLEVPHWNFYVLYASGFFISTFLVSLTGLNKLGIIRKLKPKELALLIIPRVLGTSGVMLSVAALSFGLASLVSTIFSMQSFFILVFAFILSFFKVHIETLKGRAGLAKFIAVILIIYGVFLIS